MSAPYSSKDAAHDAANLRPSRACAKHPQGCLCCRECGAADGALHARGCALDASDTGPCTRCKRARADFGGLCKWCDADDYGDEYAFEGDPRGDIAEISRAVKRGREGAPLANARGAEIAASIRAGDKATPATMTADERKAARS